MTPAARLADLPADARRSGTAFTDAWAPELSRALADAEPDEREDWFGGALKATRAAWEAGWQRRPSSRVERALLAVAADPEREPLPERACQPLRCRASTRARPAREEGGACQPTLTLGGGT